MKVKTSITLSKELLEQIDHLSSQHRNRSAFLETAAWAYIEQLQRKGHTAQDIEILNRRADYLNAEAADALLYQVPL